MKRKIIKFGNRKSFNAFSHQNKNINETDCHGRTALFMACLRNDKSLVEFLLKEKADPNIAESSISGKFKGENWFNLKRSPLHLAAKDGDYAIVSLLLKHGANANALTIDYETPLHYSVKSKFDFKIVRSLLKFQQDINYQNKHGRTALHLACANIKSTEHNNLLLIELINAGANIALLDDFGKLPIYYYFLRNNFKEYSLFNKSPGETKSSDHFISNLVQESRHCFNSERQNFIFEYALRLGAKLNSVDEKKLTPLHHAFRSDNLAMAERIIQYGGDIKARSIFGTLPISYVFDVEIMDKFYFFDESDEDVNQQDSYGLTILHYAYYLDMPAFIIQYLLNLGCDPTIRSEEGGVPISYGINGVNVKGFDFLIKETGGINHQDKEGKTLLHKVLKADNKDVLISGLLSMGIDINIQDNNGHTAFYLYLLDSHAKSYKKDVRKIIELFTHHGGIKLIEESNIFDLLLKSPMFKGAELVHLLALCGNVGDIDRLLNEKKIDLNLPDSKGELPLCYAAMNNQYEMLNCLLSKGADKTKISSDFFFFCLDSSVLKPSIQSFKLIFDESKLCALNYQGQDLVGCSIDNGLNQHTKYFTELNSAQLENLLE
ncbi:MAG: hypothetical protein DGJ47_000380 [Rickettsiaceae bacterium]